MEGERKRAMEGMGVRERKEKERGETERREVVGQRVGDREVGRKTKCLFLDLLPKA